MALEQSALLFAVGTWYFLRFLSGEEERMRPDVGPLVVQSTSEMRDGR